MLTCMLTGPLVLQYALCAVVAGFAVGVGNYITGSRSSHECVIC